MSKESAITADALREIIDYNQDTGVFTWKTRDAKWFNSKRKPARFEAERWNRRYAGTVAGSKDPKGYIRIQIGTLRVYPAHRLAWLYMTGAWPKEQIDHINLDKSDNRWGNLRRATQSQNQGNTPLRVTNSSGVRGVSQHYGKWQARIYINNKHTHLGTFEAIEAAAAAYEEAALDHFGEFARMK